MKAYVVLTFGVLAACRPTPTPQTQQSRQPLSFPVEAEDLDPDPDIVRVVLTAAKTEDGGRYPYAYNGVNPGPTIRAKVGDLLIATLVNQLDDPTTIHWHGAGAPFEMDGVAWMGAPTAAGESFEYRFRLRKAGTFWYHPHFNTSRQVEGGLNGVLIVTDPSEPEVDRDLVLVFDAAGEDLDLSSPRPHHGRSRLTDRWLINGQAPSDVTLAGGQSVRARLVNVSNTAYLALEGPLLVIAQDQGLLGAKSNPETLVLGPGDRAELEWLVGDEPLAFRTVPYTLLGGRAVGEAQGIFSVRPQPPAAAPAAPAWAFSGAPPTVDDGTTDILYAFAGSDRTGEWRINGEKFPSVTIERLQLGQAATIEVRNLSPSEHPFHMHGLPFEVLSINGQAPSHRRVEDTLNIGIRDIVRLRVIADNPGDWMVHCHILPHADEGMMTVLRVQ